MEFKDIAEINRLAYATRQDGAKGKGYPTSAEIYVSQEETGNNFELAGKVEGSKATGGMVEFKFDTVSAKRVKFIFVEANNDWASASEFWFYKEDRTLDKMERLFTDANMNEVSTEFATSEALNTLEKETGGHPFHDSFKEYIDNARLVLENKEVNFTETKVSKLLGYGTENQKVYDDKFMLGKDHIVNTQVNGGNYSGTKIEYMYDDNPNTHWETNRANGTDFTNEVVFTFDEIEQLDRIALLPRSGNQKGFPTKYEIYASETSQGDTFKLVSSGTAEVTADFMQFKFNPTNFKRLKFVFKECYQNRPFISEARFYKQDALSEKMGTLFTDNNKNKVNPDFATLDKITALENEAKGHPLYNEFKEDLNDAKQVLEGNNATYVDAKVTKFKEFGSKELEAYDDQFKISNDKITKITTNGRQWSDCSVDKAIDGNIETYWHSEDKNSSTHTNEVIMTLDELQTLDKVVYTSLRDRGFAKKFDIYTSKTLSGDTFTKVTSGSSNITKDSISIKFNPTEARRVKFVFTEAHEGWALASEFGLYKQDEVLDKMSRLFTDNTVTAVSEEFDTVEELNALENECKKHPFYEDFKEDLANARVLVEQGEIESSKAVTKKFNHLDNKDYIDQFRIPYENIKRISNNGGQYGSQRIENAVDNNISTYWETNKPNSADWGNEVTVEFVNPITIDRIAYGARQSDRKGFLEQFEVYGSNTTKGDDFHLVTTGRASSTEGLVEAKFKPTTFKRLKLKWVKSNQNWATLNEIMFFKQDVIAEKVYSIFTDQTQSELKPEYNSIQAIETLEEEIKSHPLKVELSKVIERAHKILNNSFEGNILKMDLPQNGDIHGHCKNDLMMSSFGTNFISTGVLAKPGEIIEVYVDAEPDKPLPQIMFSQSQGHYGNWQRKYSLQPGYNRFEVPKIYDEKWSHKTNPGGAIYFINPYTPEQQGKAPKIVLEGGQKFPMFNQGDDEQEFLKELKEYNEYLKANPDTGVDIFEYNSPRILFTGRASDANQVYNVEKVNVAESTLVWSKVVDDMLEYAGLEDNPETPRHDSTGIRTAIRVMQPYGGAYAAGDHVGLQQHVADDFLRIDKSSMDGIRWGNGHELGHQMDIRPRTWGEVTNNMWPNEAFYQNGLADRVNYTPIYNRVASDVDDEHTYENLDLMSRLGLFWQLRIAKDDYWKELERMYRDRRPAPANHQAKCDIMAEYSSEVLGYNLTEHFERYGMKLSDECKNRLNKYPKLDKKIWYANNSAIAYKGNGFSEDVKVTVSSSINKAAKTATLKFGIDNNNSDDLLGYEISKDGKVLGFTSGTSFTINNVDLEENTNYDIVAYAKDLSTAKPVSIKTLQPKVEAVNGLTLKLNEEFNPLEYVKATDCEGNALTDINVISNVDNKRKGEYTVTYEVTANDTTSRETMKVTVVSDYDYLSDSEWKTATTGHAEVSRNQSVKGRTLGNIKDYDKGIRLHANGEVVYDLGEHNYETFEAKVGVDMNVHAQNDSSVTFKVIGDGKTLATTKVLKHGDNMQYIKVPIKDVKELRIELNDGGNGTKADYGTIVEPKLSTNNAKPKLTIPKSQTVEVGTTLDDVVGTYKAIDVEDGDITQNVTVTGQDKVNFNRTGNYTITYTVTDNDGNTTEKSRVISVTNMEDFKYLSDVEWKSATKGWGTIGKDKSIENREITLTGEDNKPVTYKKGIGTHSHSEIVYDLTDKNVNMFSSFVGIDREVLNGPGSIEFKVYVDGDLAYESGVMRARDPQKFVQVDLAGAKELKLVVTNGGDKIASDHADWADAKLYFVNTDRVYTEELTTALEEAKKLDADTYTEASYEVLANSIAKAEALLKEEKPSQEAIDNMTTELQDSVKGLIEINLQEVVNIPDKYLVKSIQNQLGKTENITLGDMRSLTTLRLSGVVDLTGIEHARNLETLEMSHNEVKDLRPLANLKKLKTLDAKEQFIAVGELTPSNGKVVVDSKVYNREGNNVAKIVKLVDKYGNTVIEQDAKDESVISIEGLPKGLYGVHVLFEDENFDGMMMYLFHIK
ncbi:NPCBM/NEW2 domain-containing protein [Romboutsia sp. 1001713B170131_170501_G6]|uniref:NPCBM/NEW2 domain-containing protein n=1 Tax=Romboutsia sp. 1001713B170131_170501_G6 TaxID=2787108 RepID=UPI002ED13775